MTMRNHFLKLSFAILLGSALAGNGGCSSSPGTPTGGAGKGGSSSPGTAGSGGGTGGTGGSAGGSGGTGGTSVGGSGGSGGATGGSGGATGGSGGATGGGGGTVDPCAGMTAQQCNNMLINATTTSTAVTVSRPAPTISYPTCQ
jgi:hypothetical protein